MRASSPAGDRRFLTFLGGAAMADIGDQAWIVILAYAAARSGDPVTATLTVAAGTLPRAVLDLVGGAVADRVPTRRLLVSVAAGRALALAAGLLALVSLPGHTIPVMVGVAILFGAADALHKPATFTMPRQLVGVSQVVRAASLRQLVTRLAMLGGPVLAGLALGAFELNGAMAGLFAVFVGTALLMSLVRVRYQREPAESETVLASIRGVVDYLKTNAPARALVYALIGLNFFVIPVVNVGVALRVADEGWGARVLGILMACVGVGAAIGTAITLRTKPRYPVRFALVLLVLQGFAIGLVGLMPMIGVGVSLGLVGLTAGLSSPMLAGTAQAVVPANYIGRVFAVVGVADDALIPFALVGYGLVIHRIGLPLTTVICGLGMVVLMGAGLMRRSLRNLRIGHPSRFAVQSRSDRLHRARHAAGKQPRTSTQLAARRSGDAAAWDPREPIARPVGGRPEHRPSGSAAWPPADQATEPGLAAEQMVRRAVHGLEPRVQATNGSGRNVSPNGVGPNGSAVNGSAVNGSAVNGSAVNGSAVNGSAVNGSAANGFGVNGFSASGSSANGVVNRNGVNGNGVNGNGALRNGAGAISRTGARGNGTGGISPNGAIRNGSSRNGSGANGTTANGNTNGANHTSANGIGRNGPNGARCGADDHADPQRPADAARA